MPLCAAERRIWSYTRVTRPGADTCWPSLAAELGSASAGAQGIHPTRKATMVRLAKQKLKKRNAPSAPLNSVMQGRSPSPIPPWEDPVQMRLQREAEAAWVDAFLARQEQWRRRR